MTTQPLTARQLQIVTGLARGRTTTQIAQGLGLAPVTVKAHIRDICTRLAVSTTGDSRSGSIRARIVHTAYTRGHLADLAPEPRDPVDLEPMYQRLLVGLAHGHTYAQISRRLGPRPATVKARTAALRHLLGARTRAHAIALAHQMGHLTTTPTENR